MKTIALVLCSSFIIGEKIVHSADVDDSWRQTVLEGIEARESAIHSLRVKYTIVHESTDLARARSMKVLRERVEEGRLSKKEADKEASEPWRRKIITNVELLMSGGKIAAATADADPNSGWEPKRVVFDGEVLTRLEGDLGDRKLATRDEALPKTTINSFSLLGTMPIQDFIKLSGAKCTLLPRTAASGDILFQVTFTDEPEKHEGVEVQRSETTVEINATRSFWPQYLAYGFFFNVDNPKTLFNWREVRFSDFQKAGNIDIPRKIEETCSDIVNMTTGDFDLGRDWGVTERTTVIVNEIAVNEPVDASDFVLNFPPGTRYRDLDGHEKIVDPDGSIQNLSATLGERSPATEDGRNERAWGIGAWQWVALGATTLLFVILFALHFVKPLRARRSA